MGATFLTGTSSGIGRSLARRLAADGEPVVVVARRAALLDSLVAEIEAAGGRAFAIPCDVTDRLAVHEAVRRAEARFGPITRLVANAGAPVVTRVDEFDAAHVAAVTELNLMGVVHCIEAVLPGMLKRGEGHIVATSSLAGVRGLPGTAAYSASKSALTTLLEGLRVDLRSRGVDVSVIAPGFVRKKPPPKSPPKKKKANRPFRMELEPATERMHRAILARQPYFAFPRPLVALLWLARVLPARWVDRVVAGRGPGQA